MLHTWKICIRPDPNAPDVRQGYVLALNEGEALQIAGDGHAKAFPLRCLWPGAAGERLCWSN